MDRFEELLAELIEEPDEVLGTLNDIVARGRLQAEYLPAIAVETLTDYGLVAFLIQRQPRQPLRSWVYPTPLALRVYATLEREAERIDQESKALQTKAGRGRSGGGNHGISR